MPDYYSEPFVTLAGLTHKSALISWGAFYFRVKDSGKEFKLVDDDDLKNVHPPRSDSIGASSKSYGPARVEVKDPTGKVINAVAELGQNHCWVHDLSADTVYEYKVFVRSGADEEEWVRGPRRNWERVEGKMGLGPESRRYENRFRTFPAPDAPAPGPFTFAVIGDFGIGVKKDDSGQRRVAAALEKAVAEDGVRFILTTGDNIYRRGGFLGLPVGGQTGDEDDDWYFTYYQPYRYVINRVPVFPCIGNHDSPETEGRDDRAQLYDNLYVRERVEGETGAGGRASVGPGLFYRFRFGRDVEFLCLDTSKEEFQGHKMRLFEVPHHRQFIERALSNDDGGAPAWRIPFGHHPPFCAGPDHGDTKSMKESLVGLFQNAGVRLVLSGHNHNFQHNRHNGVEYIVSGAAGKLNNGRPAKSTDAERVSWAGENHFLLVTIDGDRATVKPVAAFDGEGKPVEVKRKTPAGNGDVKDALVINLH